MKYSPGAIARTLAVVLCVALTAASPAVAQGRGGPPGGGPGGAAGGGGMGGPPMGGGGMGGSMPNRPAGSMDPGFGNVPNQQTRPLVQTSGLQLGPPGQRWWDDRGFAKTLKLRPEQQARMDVIFDQNRNSLLSNLENVRQAEAQMQGLARSSTPEESALFTQIDRVAQARADLEKATTHMLLQLRKEMDADQIKRLEKASK